MLCFGFTAVYKNEQDTVKEFITGEKMSDKRSKSQAPKTLLCDVIHRGISRRLTFSAGFFYSFFEESL